MHALIIEDEPFIAMAIEKALRESGFSSFDFAISLEEAVNAVKARCPNLISADVQLSPGCGIDAVEAICREQIIPVIFVTGTADDLELRRPGSIIVHKPFTSRDIKQAIERVRNCAAKAVVSASPLDTQYYLKRAQAERSSASQSLGAEVAAIHTDLAEQYEALASQPELRSDFRIKWSDFQPWPGQSVPPWSG